MKHKNNKTKFKYKYKPKHGGANGPGANSGPSASGGPGANNTSTLEQRQRQSQRNPNAFFNQGSEPISERPNIPRYVPTNLQKNLPLAYPLNSAPAVPVPPSGPLEVKIKKPGFFSVDTLLAIPGKIQTALIFIALICFLIWLFMIYMLFTAIFLLINTIINGFNKSIKDFIKKLPFGIGKKMKAPVIKNIPPNLFELIFG
jgi:hypothetical protein